MKRYLAICCSLLVISSCLKIEDANLCKNAPPAPALSTTSYQVPLGGTLSAAVMSPDASLTYYWLSPSGLSYEGASLSHTNTYYSDYGTWGLVAQKGASCASDTVRFNVAQQVGSCGVGRDTFQINGTSYKIASEQSTIVAYYYYYKMTFTCSNGATVVVTFPSQPTTSVNYTVVSPNNSYLYSNECNMTFSAGYYYSSYSGTASVTVSGTAITIKFCSEPFYNNGTYNYVYGNGYLVGN